MSTHIIEDRLELSEAMLAAIDQNADVSSAIANAPDRAAARAAVRAVLNISELQVRAVMELRWEALNRESRRALEAERDAMRLELSSRVGGAT